MSDLSRLLDDVYGTGGSGQAPPQPEWASEEALDQAFADWVPGSLGDEPAQPAVPVPAAPAPDPMASFAASDMFGAAAEALAELGEAVLAPAPAPAAAQVAPAPAPVLPPVEDLFEAFSADAPAPAPPPLPPVEDLFEAFSQAAPAPEQAQPVQPAEAYEPAESFAVFEVPPAGRTVPDLGVFRQPTAPPVEELAEADVPPAAELSVTPWQPSDDDLLPSRKRGFSLSLPLRRR